MTFCILFYWVNISNFHKSILHSHESHGRVFAMSTTSWYGISILHVKHWSAPLVIQTWHTKCPRCPCMFWIRLVNRNLEKMLLKGWVHVHQRRWWEWHPSSSQTPAGDKSHLPFLPGTFLLKESTYSEPSHSLLPSLVSVQVTSEYTILGTGTKHLL